MPDTSVRPALPALLVDPEPLRPKATPEKIPFAAVGCSSALRNRIGAVLLHIPWYSFEGPSRLASDVHVSRSTICRMLRGTSNPSYRLVEKVTAAISSRLGKPVDPRDLFTTDATYPTESACGLCGCRGCLPPSAWDERRDVLRPEWKDARPGDWSRTSSALSAASAASATSTADSTVDSTSVTVPR